MYRLTSSSYVLLKGEKRKWVVIRRKLVSCHTYRGNQFVPSISYPRSRGTTPIQCNSLLIWPRASDLAWLKESSLPPLLFPLSSSSSLSSQFFRSFPSHPVTVTIYSQICTCMCVRFRKRDMNMVMLKANNAENKTFPKKREKGLNDIQIFARTPRQTRSFVHIAKQGKGAWVPLTFTPAFSRSASLIHECTIYMQVLGRGEENICNGSEGGWLRIICRR